MKTIEIWWKASRPRTLFASLSPVILGTALAFRFRFDPVIFVSVMITAILLQVGSNYANDYFDFRKGADNAGRLGPPRATQSGEVSPLAMRNAFIIVLSAAFLTGLPLVFRGGIPVLFAGILSLLCAVLYTATPAALAYIGLGDITVLLFFGFVAVGGSWYLQTLITPDLTVILCSLCAGLLATAILVVNNLRDIQGDEKAGKITMAVRFGEKFTRWEYIVLVSAPQLIVVYLISIHQLPKTSLLALAGIPLVMRNIIAVREKSGRDLNPVLGNTAKALLVFCLGLAIGSNLLP